MPGGTPPKPKNRKGPLYNHIALKAPTDGHKVWTWTCNECNEDFSWSSPGRVQNHLARSGRSIAVCEAVGDEAKEQFAAILRAKVASKKAGAEKQALRNAAAAAAKEQKEAKTLAKLKRGIIEVAARTHAHTPGPPGPHVRPHAHARAHARTPSLARPSPPTPRTPAPSPHARR